MDIASSTCGGILIVAVYAYRQLQHENPILNLKVFKHVALTKGTLLVMIDFGIILSAMYLLPQYIQRGMLIPVALTGIIMLPGGIATAMATSMLQMGITASHGAGSAVAFTHGVHNGIIFTIVLAVIGLLIALSINNKNELRH